MPPLKNVFSGGVLVLKKKLSKMSATEAYCKEKPERI